MDKKKPANQRSKQTRIIQRQAQEERKRMWKRVGWLGGFAVILIVVIVAFANRPSLPGEKVTVMSDITHIAELTSPHKPYNSDPPTSGDHVSYIAPWGVHKEPLPKELAVHNLEDGGVVIYYNKQVNSATITKLETLVEKYPESVIVNPYPEMKNAITLTAWGRIDRLEIFDQERISDFIKAFKGIDHH